MKTFNVFLNTTEIYYGSEKLLKLFNILFENDHIHFKRINNIHIADFVITSHGKINNEHANKPHIYWSGESYRCKIVNDKPFLEFNTFHNQGLFLPYVFDSPYWNDNIHLPVKRNNQKKILAFCASNPVKSRIEIFNKFCKELGPNNVTSLGKVYGNYKQTHKPIGGEWISSKLIDNYREHKFCFAIENTYKSGYLTEKIMNVFQSGSVPIYWGCSDTAKKIFNSKCFIDMKDFENVDKCIEYVKNMSNDEYNKFFNQHFLNPNDDILNVKFTCESLNSSKFWQNIKQNVKNFIQKI